MVYGHGNDIYGLLHPIKADFSSNIAYNHKAATIVEYLKTRMELLLDYPDPLARQLTQLLAEHHGVSAGNVLVTNGSSEAFYLLAHLFAGKRTTITYPAFAEYEDACTLYRHRLSFLPLRELRADIRLNDDTAWLAVPNNPDGYIIPPEILESIFGCSPRTHFIVDNAYGELCPLCRAVAPLHAHHPNLISVHSLTKSFAIPGLRLGYVVAGERIITALRQLQTPWSVNVLAQCAGVFVVSHYTELLPDAECLCADSLLLQQKLAAISGIEVYPSACNYFLLKLKQGTAARLKQLLIEEHGLLIRDASNFRGLTSAHFRIAVQNTEKNRLLTDALETITSSGILSQC